MSVASTQTVTTFIPKNEHISRSDLSKVGACHVDECRHNSDLTCTASSIEVGNHANHADCNTFDPRA